MADAQVRVAVVGAGSVGRGWAALCVAHGWPVSLYDVEMNALLDAKEEVVARARSLSLLKRADANTVETGISSLHLGRSLLEACGQAQWVIEAGPEDLGTKQKMFEAVESVAGGARAVTSSSSGLAPSDIAARCRRKGRCFTTHPLNPPELIPLVEVVPGPDADKATVELVKGWLYALGRIPVVIRKQVPGAVANRIAAAVWREAIDLVLNGVIDIDDLDRAISLGPALGWAAAGPHLTYHLAAGNRGVAGFLQRLLQTFETIWDDLPTWSRLEPEQQRRLIHMIERTYKEQVDVIKPARDKRLAGILWGLERSKEA
ncbi:MAG: 3-hydroxyacyl-CoA dehydrogenase family protein [Gemmatimonadota bacterium]|nr:MAG: 3-hydroxyacyl-CoA dehydrogenase family protein [Gemmatimonadota bacterium]